MKEGFLEPVPPMYLGLAFHVEKGIVPYCSREASKLVPFLSEMRSSRRRRRKELVEFGTQREDGTLFVPGNPFQLRFLHKRFKPSIFSGRDCEILWNIWLLKINGRSFSQHKNQFPILFAF